MIYKDNNKDDTTGSKLYKLYKLRFIDFIEIKQTDKYDLFFGRNNVSEIVAR